jgi:proteasome assembly chaperone 2
MPTYQIRVPNSPPLEGTALQFLHQQVDILPLYNQDSEVPFIPGGGLTRRIVTSIPRGWATPIASLLQFVIEGDNGSDAKFLASVVSKALDLGVTQWHTPSAWDVGLFGSPHEQDLYG